MLTTTLVLHKMFGRIVKLYPDNSVVKSGPGILLGERDALEFAAQLNLPVPRLVGEQSTQNAGELCNIRMSFIEGQRLDKVWGGMTADEKLDVCRQLRTILEVMQSTELSAPVMVVQHGIADNTQTTREVHSQTKQSSTTLFLTSLVRSQLEYAALSPSKYGPIIVSYFHMAI